MSVTFTPEQQQIMDQFNEAKGRMKPALLADSHLNGALISNYIRENALAPTADNFYAAVNALVGSLQWDVKPAKLRAQKNANPNAPLTEKTAWKEKLESEAARITNTKTVEEAAARKKADDASIKQSRDLISGYNPIKKGRYDAAEREEMQKKWTAALEKEIANNGNLQTFAQALSAVIQKRYDDREKASERL
jgi:hypothetical protein